MDDSDLIDGLIRRDEVAAEAFVSKYRPRIVRALRHFGVPEIDCEDVAQTVIMDAWRQLSAGSFQGRSQLFSWLYHLIRGKAAEYRRSSATRQARLTASLEDSSATTPSLRTEASQDTLALAHEALQALPLRLQIVFRLRYRENVSVEDIAVRMDLKVKRVRALLTEAKQRFSAAVRGSEKIHNRGRLTKGKE